MKSLLKITFIALALLLFTGMNEVFAANYISVTPQFIDKNAYARDEFSETLKIRNNADRKLTIYTFVHDVSVEDGRRDFVVRAGNDLAESLANWIRISRGMIELGPGEERSVDMRIEINMVARPGIYHALISFADGGIRAEAEKKLLNTPGVLVSVEILENINERLQLNSFISDREIFSGTEARFSAILENIGNRELKPEGVVRIYDRRGKEVGTVEITPGVLINPDAVEELAGTWNVDGLGRYKAYLYLRYGKNLQASLNDTVFFWVVPWQKLLFVFGTIAAGLVAITIVLHRRYEKKHHHRMKLHFETLEKLFHHQNKRSGGVSFQQERTNEQGKVVDIRSHKKS